ncbi:Uncharacterised protein [Klebsiella pneumoniae]|nr:hypothetical protein L425_01886 [Klebsiella quasipneumoniae subsp. quasipneumoniae]EWD03146.1 hypothetical protein X657_1876 [Klebsiella pneumoniae NB60]VGH84594.1 Uncharacterised protein [Klebsiella pneumoniae]
MLISFSFLTSDAFSKVRYWHGMDRLKIRKVCYER